MSWDEIIESRIQEALSEGLFDNLPGAGRPLPQRPEDALAGTNWLGNKILRDAGALPEWLLIAKEIESEQAALAGMEKRHTEYVQLACESGDWVRFGPLCRKLEERFEEAARALRRKQDQWNYDAPSMHLERPSVWVDDRVARLRARRLAAFDDERAAAS